jgi:dephospho-CoA kinase
MKRPLLVLIAGMPGAGKSIVSRAARDLGLPVYNMGDVIRSETLKIYGEITPEYMRETSRIVREKYGEDYVARKTIERIRERSGVIVIDGVRSLVEVEVFREFGDTVILAIHASPRTRFERIRRRGRPGDPDKWEDFVKRDMTELSFGLGNVIALADYMIVNEGTIEEAYRGAYNILSKLVEGYGKDQGYNTH